MAATTTWGFTGVAGTTTSFPIEGTNIYGVDLSGALTPAIIQLGTGMELLVTAGATTAEIAAAMLAWLRPRGYAHDGCGGVKAVSNDGSVDVALTVTS